VAKHLITGGAGFIGSHLAELLLSRGQEVSVIDNLSSGRISNITSFEGNKLFRCYIDDVRNEHLTEELIRDADFVYHLAASVGVRMIIDRPTETIINNIMGAEVVLRNACRYRKPLLITSTSEVYGKSSRPTFCETDDRIMGATSKSRWSYAESKAIDEFLALAYHSEKRLPVVIVRLFNTVGPRQTGRYGMVIPTFVRQALLDEAVTVFGDGSQSRCFAHVRDVVPVLAELITRSDAYGSVVNVGSQEEVSIKELAERIIAKAQSKSTVRLVPYVQAYPPGFEDMERRMPDLDRVKSLTGYSPRHRLDQIIEDVITDLREQLRSHDSFAQATV
jgi:nucleoside-diphosphate-sugar epimerase